MRKRSPCVLNFDRWKPQRWERAQNLSDHRQTDPNNRHLAARIAIFAVVRSFNTSSVVSDASVNRSLRTSVASA